MLVLSRRYGQVVVIGSGPNRVTVQILGVDREGKVSLGFDAPKHIPVNRLEIFKSKFPDDDLTNAENEKADASPVS